MKRSRILWSVGLAFSLSGCAGVGQSRVGQSFSQAKAATTASAAAARERFSARVLSWRQRKGEAAAAASPALSGGNTEAVSPDEAGGGEATARSASPRVKTRQTDPWPAPKDPITERISRYFPGLDRGGRSPATAGPPAVDVWAESARVAQARRARKEREAEGDAGVGDPTVLPVAMDVGTGGTTVRARPRPRLAPPTNARPEGRPVASAPPAVGRDAATIPAVGEAGAVVRVERTSALSGGGNGGGGAAVIPDEFLVGYQPPDPGPAPPPRARSVPAVEPAPAPEPAVEPAPAPVPPAEPAAEAPAPEMPAPDAPPETTEPAPAPTPAPAPAGQAPAPATAPVPTAQGPAAPGAGGRHGSRKPGLLNALAHRRAHRAKAAAGHLAALPTPPVPSKQMPGAVHTPAAEVDRPDAAAAPAPAGPSLAMSAPVSPYATPIDTAVPAGVIFPAAYYVNPGADAVRGFGPAGRIAAAGTARPLAGGLPPLPGPKADASAPPTPRRASLWTRLVARFRTEAAPAPAASDRSVGRAEPGDVAERGRRDVVERVAIQSAHEPPEG